MKGNVMKKTTLIPWLALCLCAVSGSCKTTDTSSLAAAPRSAPAPTRVEPTAANPQIRKGMTKQQVIAAWGEPSSRQVSGSGEIWTWGGQRWKGMIPYAGPFVNVQTGRVIFGTNGRVRDFRLTDRGDMMSDMEGYTPGYMPW